MPRFRGIPLKFYKNTFSERMPVIYGQGERYGKRQKQYTGG